ncbi:uncharacterized protein SPPG_04021 [Spizellomyces punctatus DAOM BR117]|uniref:Uncharacterized protein n=1 Tax=Spizellomyces punctatus (strain DAOM BR117) TaxID=645134 RepID=A0A0L0HHI3_SPIPD|nr:uncharacterized protein SPPG_04021 [Spizellomyces punctatus DAOM BR117]KND00921.1 hypothetical protein SPPG_04021 [Spizellomyces punctatus DAOM BR117]|eukprot:XP_016608960.1 hypothetical protein SPPG_04021 [Spizellomyces punctatus DAOM BR117]
MNDEAALKSNFEKGKKPTLDQSIPSLKEKAASPEQSTRRVQVEPQSQVQARNATTGKDAALNSQDLADLDLSKLSPQDEDEVDLDLSKLSPTDELALETKLDKGKRSMLDLSSATPATPETSQQKRTDRMLQDKQAAGQFDQVQQRLPHVRLQDSQEKSSALAAEPDERHLQGVPTGTVHAQMPAPPIPPPIIEIGNKIYSVRNFYVATPIPSNFFPPRSPSAVQASAECWDDLFKTIPDEYRTQLEEILRPFRGEMEKKYGNHVPPPPEIGLYVGMIRGLTIQFKIMAIAPQLSSPLMGGGGMFSPMFQPGGYGFPSNPYVSYMGTSPVNPTMPMGGVGGNVYPQGPK